MQKHAPRKNSAFLSLLQSLDVPSLEPKALNYYTGKTVERIRLLWKLISRLEKSDANNDKAKAVAFRHDMGLFEEQLRRLKGLESDSPFSSKEPMADRASVSEEPTNGQGGNQASVQDDGEETSQTKRKGTLLTKNQRTIRNLQSQIAEIDARLGNPSLNGQAEVLEARKTFLEGLVEKLEYSERLRGGSVFGNITVDKKRERVESLERELDVLAGYITRELARKKAAGEGRGNWTSVDEQVLHRLIMRERNAKIQLADVWELIPIIPKIDDSHDGLSQDQTHGTVSISKTW